MQNITIERYSAEHARDTGFQGHLEPADKSWIAGST